MNCLLLGSNLPRNARVPFDLGQICGRRKIIVIISVSDCRFAVIPSLVDDLPVVAKVIVCRENLSTLFFYIRLSEKKSIHTCREELMGHLVQ